MFLLHKNAPRGCDQMHDYEIKLAYDAQFADLQKLKKEKEAQSR